MITSRNFKLYLAGATLSAIGTSLVSVALSFAVLDTGLPASALGLGLARRQPNRSPVMQLAET